ncbi:RrF2 family transcriptional regulator [Hespellia stercorisuis]|uniref:Transcriptional regulator, BadM/Rrf2 family n=1 Tax=Hespellia stercorisuis DSM 15480 TaxID=1121950 RepID=A0A1M6VZY9_9FIRM|nr:Rrf2 family transcriptional regulator [Hespellia stercorisuis]SHK87071.1 transcriptional regulator, BadM/Rrf2 family [Hespellia stercorisuis DSM 15480]
MQLTLMTDYAIRTVLYLTQKGGIVPAGEIAQSMSIPKAYLMKALNTLRKAGYIDASTGVNGGYWMLVEAEELTLLDIIQATESTTKLNRCMEQDHFCSRVATKDCPVRSFYMTVQSTIEKQLSAMTIANLLEENKAGQEEYQ